MKIRFNRTARVLNIAVLVALVMAFAAVALPAQAQEEPQRICYGTGEVRAAIFANDRGGFDVYGINDDDAGNLIKSYSEDELAALEETPAKDLLMLENDDYVNLSLYKLTTGEYLVNAGPDAIGKVYSCKFNSAAPDEITSWTNYAFLGADIVEGEE